MASMANPCFHTYFKKNVASSKFECQIGSCVSQYNDYNVKYFSRHIKQFHTSEYSREIKCCRLSVDDCIAAANRIDEIIEIDDDDDDIEEIDNNDEIEEIDLDNDNDDEEVDGVEEFEVDDDNEEIDDGDEVEVDDDSDDGADVKEVEVEYDSDDEETDDGDDDEEVEADDDEEIVVDDVGEVEIDGVEEVNETDQMEIDASESDDTDNGRDGMERRRLKRLRKIPRIIHTKQLLAACVELVTINGRPFDILNDSGFKKIVGPLVKHIKMKNPTRSKFQIDTSIIRSEIIKQYSEIKRDITEMIKDKFINIHFDVMTRKDRTILGIHAHVLYLGAPKLKTLAIIEFNKETKPACLKKKIVDTLKTFGVRVEQVLTISVKNYTEFVQLDFRKIEENSLWRHDLDSLIHVVFIFENKMIKTENDVDGQQSNEQRPDYTLFVKELNNEPKSLVCLLNCTAFSIHKCIERTLKHEPYNAIVKRVEQILLHLRAPHMMELIKKLNVREDLLLSETELYTSYDILFNFLALRRSLIILAPNHPEVWMSQSHWGQVETLYLDPRFQCLLDDKKKTMAKIFLIRTMDVMGWLVNGNPDTTDDENCIDIESSDDDDDNTQIENPPIDTGASGSNTFGCEHFVLDEIEQFIREKKSAIIVPPAPVLIYKNTLRAKLEVFGKTPRLHHSTNIKRFWEERKLTDPDLYKLSQIFLTIPVNDLSISRCSAGLNFLLSDARTPLSRYLLEKIMVVRGNQDNRLF